MEYYQPEKDKNDSLPIEWYEFQKARADAKFLRERKKAAILECFELAEKNNFPISISMILGWLFVHYEWLKAEKSIYKILCGFLMNGVIELVEIKNNQRFYKLSKRKIKRINVERIKFNEEE
ncbi:MAG: hypothetical protein KME28_27435 [Pelatocladus maniniholoensis HA4357-MV3]|jgi:hypothetical protein|uniref:Uncharacterized protein n=1 Tax=Pelatocladus maniniholoensis HA4357-MV3 TaxID=1117104 RepID=A0A9E3HFF2_9NOST|nr:hypothetical protein [Pelatocladus maniniholoensis HA4357-MV3]